MRRNISELEPNKTTKLALLEADARSYVAKQCPHLTSEQQEPVVAKVIKATRAALGE